jgi:S2P endopeptidase
MITLSLHFFNLLPLPFLDGAQLLSALLDLIPLFSEDRERIGDIRLARMESARPWPQDEDPGSTSSRRSGRRFQKEAVENVVQKFTLLLMAAGAVLGVVSWLKDV